MQIRVIYRNKIVDLVVQSLFIVMFLMCFLVFSANNKELGIQIVGSSYCLIGGCQIISCLINKFKLPAVYKVPDRWGYEIILLVLIIITAISFAFPALLNGILFTILWVMLYLTPVMALWYLAITIREILKIRKAIVNIDKNIA